MPSSKDRRRLEVSKAIHERLSQMADTEGRTVASLVHDLLLTAMQDYEPVWIPSKHLSRLNPRMRRVLVLAEEEAAGFNHGFIGTEHLLLGLLREEQGLAAQTLTSLGLTLADARSTVREIYAPAAANKPAAQSDTSVTVERDYTRRTRKVLGLALDEMQRRGDGLVRTEHLLLAIIREGGLFGVQLPPRATLLPYAPLYRSLGLGRADADADAATPASAQPALN